ncbi:hypothetical protein Q664_26850 [Archangium violaceum Cb vi76]|uniref:Uncharacterized protein n=1 Tax=Archangium violaceum Cb vi76 TaxID=1406225 RepID=A0A084SQK1_9BACT|nr:hypothetical protein Q664_26850 [Archangium violaceum Cb vi76]
MSPRRPATSNGSARLYKANPDAFDNQGILRNAPSPAVRQRIINGRIKHLEDEIRAFEKAIRDLGGEP